MAITLRRSFVSLRETPLTTKDDMLAVGQLVRQRILERTARGLDAAGRPFAPYSVDYGEAKREALGSSGTVDLTVSGEMLRAITIEATDRTVRLSFAR